MKSRKSKVNQGDVFRPSTEVVSRKIEGEIIIIPLTGGVGDLEDDLFTLNKTGMAIWEKLDGVRSVREIVRELASEYGAPQAEIDADVAGLLSELVRRGIVTCR